MLRIFAPTLPYYLSQGRCIDACCKRENIAYRALNGKVKGTWKKGKCTISFLFERMILRTTYRARSKDILSATAKKEDQLKWKEQRGGKKSVVLWTNNSKVVLIKQPAKRRLGWFCASWIGIGKARQRATCTKLFWQYAREHSTFYSFIFLKVFFFLTLSLSRNHSLFIAK